MSLTIAHAVSVPAAHTGPGACCDRSGRKGDGKVAGVEQALSQEEQRQVEALKQRDREVRAHEAAHLAAAGGYARGRAAFSYARGPDGRLYAVGGEVGIDVSPVAGDPEATLRKAETVRRAALAPAEPSGQDRSVAARAAAMAIQARRQVAEERQAATREDDGVSGRQALMEQIRAGGAAGTGSTGALHLVA